MSDLNTGYTIRQFSAEDMQAYRGIRLEALQLEPGVFGNSYAMEAAMTDEEWRERITNPRYARFGLFYGGELVGLTAVIADEADGTLGYMTQSYIRAAHRGRGLSRMLYDARIKWASASGVKKLTIGHRGSNVASKTANQRYGFVFTHAESRVWPDGTTDDMVYYELSI